LCVYICFDMPLYFLWMDFHPSNIYMNDHFLSFLRTNDHISYLHSVCGALPTRLWDEFLAPHEPGPTRVFSFLSISRDRWTCYPSTRGLTNHQISYLHSLRGALLTRFWDEFLALHEPVPTRVFFFFFVNFMRQVDLLSFNTRTSPNLASCKNL
jgi:hypothetical protein